MTDATDALRDALDELHAERDQLDTQIDALRNALAALQGAESDPRPRGRRARRAGSQKRSGRSSASKAKPASGTRSPNTRSAAGRAAFDEAVLAALKQLGGEQIAAVDVRAEVGGSAAQVRSALDRLIEAGKVTFEGRTRATRYSTLKWGPAGSRTGTGHLHQPPAEPATPCGALPLSYIPHAVGPAAQGAPRRVRHEEACNALDYVRIRISLGRRSCKPRFDRLPRWARKRACRRRVDRATVGRQELPCISAL